MSGAMTKGEREDLQRLIRQREKVLKSAAKQRSSELLADFENQLGSIYSFDDDAIWKEAERIAKQEVEKANAKIAARAAELGIPKDFAPSVGSVWIERGANMVKARRNELRRMARRGSRRSRRKRSSRSSLVALRRKQRSLQAD